LATKTKNKKLFIKFCFFFWRRKKARPLPKSPEKILVVRQDNRIGNLILITPFLELCRRQFPQATIDIVVGGSFGSLLSNNPNIDSILVYNQLKFIRNPWLFPFFLFCLKRKRYDIVFDMKNALSFNNIMITLLSGARTRVGFKHEASDVFFDYSVPSINTEYVAHDLVSLLLPWRTTKHIPQILYIPVSTAVANAASSLTQTGLPAKKTVAIHTGGRGSKRLSLDVFASIGKTLTNRNIPVLFFFGPDEKDDMPVFRNNGFNCLCPKSVEEFGGYLPHLIHFISCDTGPLHMAAGANVPTISIFINTSAVQYAPRGDIHKTVGFPNSHISDEISAIVFSALEQKSQLAK
jgi:ADP-heptose:LPS heptosyltransferase